MDGHALVCTLVLIASAYHLGNAAQSFLVPPAGPVPNGKKTKNGLYSANCSLSVVTILVAYPTSILIGPPSKQNPGLLPAFMPLLHDPWDSIFPILEVGPD